MDLEVQGGLSRWDTSLRIRRNMGRVGSSYDDALPRYEGNNPVPRTIDLHALDSRGSFSRWTVYNTPDGLSPDNGVAP